MKTNTDLGSASVGSDSPNQSNETRHVSVFPNVGHFTQPQTVYIARLDAKNRLGARVSETVILGFEGSIRDAIAAFDAGDHKNGNRILCNRV